MAKWLITVKDKGQGHCKSLKGQGLAQLIVQVTYQISPTKLQTVV